MYSANQTKDGDQTQFFRNDRADEVGPRLGQKVEFGLGVAETLSPEAARVHGDPRLDDVVSLCIHALPRIKKAGQTLHSIGLPDHGGNAHDERPTNRNCGVLHLQSGHEYHDAAKTSDDGRGAEVW